MNYYDYLLSHEWQEKRSAALVAAGNRCQVCNSPNNLDVHHRTYERLGNEQPGDMTVLCRTCHALFSSRLPKPPFYWLSVLGWNIEVPVYV